MAARWMEFRLGYSKAYVAHPRDPDIFHFKKNTLLPIIQDLNIPYFLTLDQGAATLVRIECDEQLEAKFKETLGKAVEQPRKYPFDRVIEPQPWDPALDARNRIRDARGRATQPGSSISFEGVPEEGGWAIKGGPDATGRWKALPEKLDKEIDQFATFMARVAGRYTRAFLEEMPDRVDNRWLQSVFIHLLLNSISFNQQEEADIRSFPYV